MNRLTLLLILVLSISTCKQKEYTLEELEKVQWNNMTQGVDYISTEDEKGIAAKNDSVEIKIKGVSGSKINPAEMSFNDIVPEINKAFSSLLESYLPDSKAGYLKVNFPEMTRPAMLSGRIYLRGEYDEQISFTSDSTSLIGIPGIITVNFTSKEEAKKEYLADGNSDWDKVLENNPLPDCIEISLEKKEWTEETLNDLKTLILGHLITVSDISFPGLLLKKSDEYFFFEYKRK